MDRLGEFERIMDRGYAYVTCDECGFDAQVEPDCDEPCPCGEGRLTSPLITEGLI